MSYASEDASVADAVCGAIERAGVGCWIASRDVVPGEFYADAIVRAIDAANVLVLVLSRSAASSPHVVREVERAASKRHPVVSFRIDARADAARARVLSQYLPLARYECIGRRPGSAEVGRSGEAPGSACHRSGGLAECARLERAERGDGGPCER